MRLNGVFAPTEKFPTAVKEIRVEERAAAKKVCNLELDPGGRMTLRTIDPDGAPLSGVLVTGVSEIDGREEPMAARDFDLVCFRPGENRTVLLYHPERRLGKALRVKAEDADDGPLTVALEPVGRRDRAGRQGRRADVGRFARIDVAGDNDFGRELAASRPPTARDVSDTRRSCPGWATTSIAEGAGCEFRPSPRSWR